MSEPDRLDEIVGGKYRIVRFLASGGMGSVYEAQHTVVRRRFAVKFLHRDLAVRRELLTRFQREAEAAGALESENVAAAVDFGIATDGAPYIVLEYLVGESLEHLLEREGYLPVERATNLVLQACRGVQAAHAAGIVHRDLKPHNLFVCRREDGTDLVKVLDFGVAKLEIAEQGVAATRTGTVLGTPSYMSPEQARGEKNIDAHSDVYALGAILYELLSGKKPHPGDSHNAILHHIATQPALPLAAAAPDLPAELLQVTEGALSSEVSARPKSAEAFAQALAPWARSEVWPAAKVEPSAPRHAEPSSTLLAPAVSPSPSSSPSPASRSVASTPARVVTDSAGARRSNAPVIVGGLVLLGVVAVLALRRPEGVSEPPPAAAAPPPAAAVALPAAPTGMAEPAALQAAPMPATAALEKPAAAMDAREPAPAPERKVTSRPAPPPVPAPPPALTNVQTGRPAGRPVTVDSAAEGARSKPKTDDTMRGGPVTFDQKNPYQ